METISPESVLLLQEESDFKGYRERIVMDERMEAVCLKRGKTFVCSWGKLTVTFKIHSLGGWLHY